MLRGASLECPVCGEFVLHEGRRRVRCPECEMTLHGRSERRGPCCLQLDLQAG